jgi:SAM-dependent methyltransferase
MTTESVREYWDGQPCDGAFGNDWKQIRSRRYFVNSHIPEWADFKSWERKQVLEIGCGQGTDAISFAERGALVTATDLSPVSVALAKSHAESAGVSDRINFLVADAQRLNEYLEPQQFDLVYSCGVLHHLPEPQRVIDQVRQHYLKPGSVFKLLVYYRYSWVPMALLLRRSKGSFWKLNELVRKYSEEGTGCPIVNMFSRREVRDLLQGFRVTDANARWLYPYRDHEGTHKTWYFRLIPNSVLRRLEPLLGWHLCVTATLIDE